MEKRLSQVIGNARAKLEEAKLERGKTFYGRTAYVPREPICIGSNEDVGTRRVLANHYDGAIDFFEEQERLKAKGAPIKSLSMSSEY